VPKKQKKEAESQTDHSFASNEKGGWRRGETEKNTIEKKKTTKGEERRRNSCSPEICQHKALGKARYFSGFRGEGNWIQHERGNSWGKGVTVTFGDSRGCLPSTRERKGRRLT